MNRQQTTVGILYPGELGASLGRLLSGDGFHVVTTVEGRGPITCRRCREAGLETLGSLGEVVQSSEIVLSVVPPAAALQVAEQYCSLAHLSRPDALYVDVNSISPATARQIAALLSASKIEFLDASVHGLASRLAEMGTLYLSGPAADEVARLFGPSLQVTVLGTRPGQASAFKMMLGGMSKGLAALFLEMSLLAREIGLLAEFLEHSKAYYPGVVTAIARLLPTYPQHAARRGDEMRELESTMLSLGLEPCMARGARRLIAAVGRLDLAERSRHPDGYDWNVCEVIEAVYARNPLRLPHSG